MRAGSRRTLLTTRGLVLKKSRMPNGAPLLEMLTERFGYCRGVLSSSFFQSDIVPFVLLKLELSFSRSGLASIKSVDLLETPFLPASNSESLDLLRLFRGWLAQLPEGEGTPTFFERVYTLLRLWNLDDSRYALYFLWGSLLLLEQQGVRANFSLCSICQNSLNGERNKICFTEDGQLCCHRCSASGLNELSLGAYRLLLAVVEIELSQMSRLGCSVSQGLELIRFAQQVIMSSLDLRLVS